MEGAAQPGLLEVFEEVRLAARALTEARWTVAVAESCTGGLLGAALTALPGSSSYFRGGVIAYADDVKVAELGVSAATLRNDGAVSQAVAEQMARGARDRIGADAGVGITGVAGPGAEGAKPAGLVYVAVADAAGQAVARREWDAGREGNRVDAVRDALRLLTARARAAAGHA